MLSMWTPSVSVERLSESRSWRSWYVPYGSRPSKGIVPTWLGDCNIWDLHPLPKLLNHSREPDFEKERNEKQNCREGISGLKSSPLRSLEA
jgi:hypothetical protein